MESKDLNLKITITFHSKIQIPHQEAMNLRKLKKKSNSILAFTESMLKTLRMDEFNQFLRGEKAYLKSFPGAKVKQLNHQWSFSTTSTSV